MSYRHRKKHRLRLRKHYRVLTFIAAVVLIIFYAYAFAWEVVGAGWARIWRSSHRHSWVDAPPPGPSGHRR